MIRLFWFGLILGNGAWAVCVPGAIPPAAPYSLAAAHARELTLTQNLRQAAQALRADIASAGPEIEKSWRDYLSWDSWAGPLLERGEWSADVLAALASRFYGTQPGFDRPQLLRMRLAVDEAVSYRFARSGLGAAPELEYQARLREVVRLLQASACSLDRLEDLVGELAVLGQAHSLVSWIKAQLAHSNFVVRVSPSQYRPTLAEYGKQSTSVKSASNTILGARVTGTNYATTQASADVVNAAEGVRLRVSVAGTIQSPHSVARKGPVTVHGSSVSQLQATADIAWDGRQFRLLPPQVSATTQSQTDRIEAPFLLRRIAARKAEKSKPQAEAIGADLVESEARRDIQSQLQPEVSKLNGQAGDLLKTIEKSGVYPELWQTHLATDALQLGVRLPSFSGLGSMPKRFPAIGTSTAMSLSLHETAASGLFRHGLAGATWQDVQFAQLQREITGMNSEAFFIGASPHRWSVVWDWQAPVRLKISPEGITFNYRFRAVTVDGKRYDVPVSVQSRFSVVATDLGLEFRRNADVVAQSLSSVAPLDAELKGFLEEKFAGLFEEVFYLDGLQFPAGGEFNAIAKYELESVHLEPSWIHLSVKEKAETAPAVIAK